MIIYVNRDKKLDKESENNLYKACLELYEYPNPKYKDLAIRLAKYAYTATGFKLWISTFFHLLPPTIIVDLKFTDFITAEQRTIDQIPGQLGEAYVIILKHISGN